MGELLGRRFHRLFGADERSVVIAMDHGTTDGAVLGFENPEQVLEQVIAGGADAILTSIGIARHFSKQLKDIGLMIRCDGATSPLLERPRALVIGVDDLLSAGAGAAGVVIGRNVWQAASPTGMTQALVALVHHDVSVDDALHILHESR